MSRFTASLAIIGVATFITLASGSACEPPPDTPTLPPLFFPTEIDDEYPAGSFSSLDAYYDSLGAWNSSPPGSTPGTQPNRSPAPQETTKASPAATDRTPNGTHGTSSGGSTGSSTSGTSSGSSGSSSHSTFGEPSEAPTPSATMYAFTEAQPTPAPARGVQSRIGFIVGASTAAALLLVLVVSAIGHLRARKRATNTSGQVNNTSSNDAAHSAGNREVSIAMASVAESELFYSVVSCSELEEQSIRRGRASSMTRCETDAFHSCLSETSAS